MMKLKSKAGAMLLTAVMIGTAATTPVQAASNVSGNINGTNCYGSISYVFAPGGACNGVLAKTTYGQGGGTLSVTAKVFYQTKSGKKTSSASNYASGSGTSAIARNNDNGNVYGGKGTHKVSAGAYTWEKNTQIGTTW